MALITKVKVGQKLYDRHSYRQGNTTIRAEGEWQVMVVEIDLEKGRVLCSWNFNKPTWYYYSKFKKLKYKPKYRYNGGTVEKEKIFG